MQTENQKINLPILEEKKVTLSIKREDKIHPFVSGNKYRKLKYNVQKALQDNYDTLLTFGGAFSNHIAAAACAAQESGLRSIGIIRGEELAYKWKDNPTLATAADMGMQLQFVPRNLYREKNSEEFLGHLKSEFGRFYLLPEGGSNDLAVKGCEEILTEDDTVFDIICGCVGTGGTIAGMINATGNHQKVLGFPALKGDFLKESIRKFTAKENWELQTTYHFGGYAKVTSEYINFINEFKRCTQIPLDPVYTGKMMYGLMDMVKNDRFLPGTRILAIHTGGLQGIKGMNVTLKKKNLPLIDL
ncbi:pyridoxal-phosphate dependent enzyme [Maribacter luteus]|uniref:Pyridoxal-phosphate dependent enzyme n=1 Tax=Maribacter luteus TaxID=2594478 RepID=A0A6I2MJ67_9FLAO|nr:pyridoxal-phosphate dependent enzyme [Maribacter luteus]